MVGRNKQVNRFNVSLIYLTCDNTVNTIPAGSPERSTSCSRFLLPCQCSQIARLVLSPLKRRGLSEVGPPPNLEGVKNPVFLITLISHVQAVASCGQGVLHGRG